ARGGMQQELAGFEHLDQQRQDARRRREEARVDQAGARRDLPDQQQPDRRRDAQDAVAVAKRQGAWPRRRRDGGLYGHRLAPISALSSTCPARCPSSRGLAQMRCTSPPYSGAPCRSMMLRGRASATGTNCLSRPGCAVITMTRSPSSTASSTLWVMNTTVF